MAPRAFGLRLRDDVYEHSSALHDRLTGFSQPVAEVNERTLRELLLLGFFEGTCERSRVRLKELGATDAPRVRALEGTRFACGESGACCRGYVFGPVSAAEKRRIEELAPRAALPHLGDRPLFVETAPAGDEPVYRLATVGDTCVFLDERRQCGLHRAFGPAAKPRLCRLFPLATLKTIDGLKVYDRAECSTFAVSSRNGPFTDELVASIEGLGDEPLYHPAVRIHGSLRCDYGLILALSQRLDEEARAAPPLEALQRIGHVVRAFAVALTRCPLEPGQPEATVDALLAKPLAELRPSDEIVAAGATNGLRNLAALCDALADRASPSESMTPAFTAATSAAAAVCRGLLAEPATSPAPPLDTAVGAALTWSLRQQLFGRDLLLDESLPAGLLRIALVVSLTLVTVRALTSEQPRRRLSLTQLSARHMSIKRTLHRPEPHRLLAANDDKAWSVLDALPLLGAAA
jgi:Fe-S-cluster containining protein